LIVSSNFKKYFESHWVILVGVLLLGIRVYPLLRQPSLWAEDSIIFYGPLFLKSDTSSFFHFSYYAGQHWVAIELTARVIFWLFHHKVVYLPLASTIAALAITLFSAAAWLKSKNLLSSRKNRELVFCFILLAPSSWESLGNLSNSYVYFFVGIFALSGWGLPKKRSHWIFESFVLIILSLTSICAVFIALSLFIRGVLNRAKIYYYLSIFYLLLALTQVHGWYQRGTNTTPIDLTRSIGQVIYIVIKRIGVETLIGQNGGNRYSSIDSWQLWTLIALFPIFVFSVILIEFNFNTNREYLLKFWSMFSLGALHFSLSIFATFGVGLNQLYLFGAGGRYLLITHISIFIGFVIIYEFIQEQHRLPLQKYWIYGATAIFIFGMFIDFLLPLKTNSTYQEGWKDFAKCVKEVDNECTVTVPPGGAWIIHHS